MKKKIVLFLVAAFTLLGCVSALAAQTNRLIVVCYDDAGKLVYSTLMSEGEHKEIPEEFENTAKKIFVVDADKFITMEEYDAVSSATVPAATAAPTEAPKETAKPASTPKATAAPALDADSPYEKAADGVYAPALITDIVRSTNSDNTEITSLTVYYQGKEVSIPIEDEVTISSAPVEYADLKGQTAMSLKKGDVICMSANVAGTRIKTLDLILRPAKEDIVTGTESYGTNFEDLFTTGSSVAGKWPYQKYGRNVTNDKYSYAFGIVADVNNGTVTLLNKSSNPDDALEIDLSPNAYVYTCDVRGTEYDFAAGGIYDIETSLPSSILREDSITLDDGYSYNYALVRMVNGTATDIIEYTNYND